MDGPGLPGWPLNDAVDHLLKNEFDLLRKDGKRHALMEKCGIDAIPFQHPDLPEWRDDHNRFVGVSVLHKPTNLELCGIIDDIWVTPKGQLHIVDYKSTSTSKEISLDDEYKQGYKKQVEMSGTSTSPNARSLTSKLFCPRPQNCAPESVDLRAYKKNFCIVKNKEI